MVTCIGVCSYPVVIQPAVTTGQYGLNTHIWAYLCAVVLIGQGSFKDFKVGRRWNSKSSYFVFIIGIYLSILMYVKNRGIILVNMKNLIF